MKSVSKLKKDLDKWFSLYIRLRDATDEGMVQCFTCGKAAHYKDGMQCGHFQSRKHQATRWNEQNCQVQCVGCNMFKQGEQWTFGLNLDAKYGSSTSFDLHVLSKQTLKMTRADYEEDIRYYKALVDNLKKEKNLV